jgi:hypothetical protein
LYFTYGHIVRLISQMMGTGYESSIQIAVYIISSLILLFAVRGIQRLRQNLDQWITILNISAFVLVIFPLFQIVTILLQLRGSANPQPVAHAQVDTTEAGRQYPDIYYIILDGYSRADTLKELGYDNSYFLDSLKQDGFFVASCSRSNYRATLLSMTSIFNMDYLWDVIPNSGGNDTNSAPLYDDLIHNKVRSELEKRGYKIISFETGYQWDEWKDADLYLAPKSSTVLDYLLSPTITPFEYIFLRNTAVLPLVQNSSFVTTRFYPQFNRVNYVLEELPKLVTMSGPKFVYAHILAPHYPFIFLPDGSLNTDNRYYDTEESAPSDSALFTAGYINNVKFLDHRIPDIVKAILDKSKTPPVIVIQGDHGFVIPERRYNNLNVLYLPNGGTRELYPEITSVNTFRVIFNAYFGAKLELLKDVSLDADIGYPYRRRVHKPFPDACPN